MKTIEDMRVFLIAVFALFCVCVLAHAIFNQGLPDRTKMLFDELQGGQYGQEKVLCVNWKYDGTQFHTYYLMKVVRPSELAKKEWIHTIVMSERGWEERYIMNCIPKKGQR